MRKKTDMLIPTIVMAVIAGILARISITEFLDKR